MQAVDEFHELLGELIKRHRAQRMDQQEFALRVGCSPKTVSRMEQGVPVNSETLFTALALLGQLDAFLALADSQLKMVSDLPQRKRDGSTAPQGLDNDF
ncbi:XRE family transcriptional regulator [Pseudidiomarina aestuarii]|uniref:XRE family transcriptional regulator n=1 Tax=Pseudidiomarina aestuarii TaxID=624146 RepID=A0A2T4D0E1_9GAMM|nr:XRE family transcriptional regulator [Pseudidiomarina aestuarii]PTB87275.1 XRE family transcriptional regulator [Pseudidiomarina aestuarii]PTB90282.1 XRE family transcriptional regulator [Pseudidiomarina aestuarii]